MPRMTKAAQTSAMGHLGFGGQARQPAQQPGDRAGERDVDHDQRHVAHRQPARVGDRLRRAHDLVDDPGLAAHLGRDPAADQRDEGERTGDHHRPEEPRRFGEPAPPPPADEEPQPEQREPRADARHRLEGDPHDVDRRPVARRNRLQALDRRVRVVPGEQREHPRDVHAVLDVAVGVVAAERERRALRRALQALHRGELGGLAIGHLAPRPIANEHLDGRGQRGEGERDDQRRAVVVGAPALEPARGVDARDQEAGDEVAGEVHVDQLVPHVGVEQCLPRPRVDHAPADEREALRRVHPAVDRDHVERAREPAEHHGDAGPEVRAPREAVPAVDVDGDEDRLDEERDALQREADPEDLAETRHELRPQQPELEAEDRARDHAHREDDQRHLRPALGERLVGRVAGAQVEALDEQEHRREGDPEAHDRNVDGQRQRLHLARLEDLRSGEHERDCTLTRAVRIVGVEVFGYRLRYAHGAYVMSQNRSIDALPSTVVRVTTDTGISGWGETCPLGPTYLEAFAGGARAALAELAPALLGVDPRNLRAAHHALDGALRGHAYAKSAGHLACWDVLGRALDVPVATLLGGVRSPDFPLYVAIPLGPLDAMVAHARDRQAEGVCHFQLKLGGDPREDAARVRAVLETDLDVVVADANGGWRLQDATIAARALEGLDRVLFEQPCPTFEECLAVRERTTLPMVLDELITDARAVIRAYGAIDGINLKLGRVGGLAPARLLRDLGQELGLRFTLEDSWGGDLTTAAVSHLAASTRPEALLMASFMNDWTLDHIAGYQPRSLRGRGAAPSGPGLGVDVDVEALGAPLLSLR